MKIHTKMARFWLFFGGKKLVKSDKLVLLIDGKFLNLIILVIYISVVSIENWLQVTHNHRQKNSQRRALQPYYCGSSLLRSVELPDVDRAF